MRRLRGEQFCSVEHLDLFTAQQAELALERLAAAEALPPPSSRPALLKQLPREEESFPPELPPPTLKLAPREPVPVEAPETEPLVAAPVPSDPVVLNGLGLSDPPKVEVRVQPKLQATVQEVPQAESEAAFLRLAEVLAEPRVTPPPPLAPPVSPKPVPEYPLAAFISHIEVSPRAPRRQGGLESFAPVETWGRVRHPSAMPKLRTQPADANEIRTWNAGKLASKVPPPAPSREFLAGRKPSAYAGPQGGEFEPEILSAGSQPKMPALDTQVAEIQAEWQGTDIVRLLSPLSGFRFQQLQLTPYAVEFGLQAEEFQSTVRPPEHHWVPSSAVVAPQVASFQIVAPTAQSGSLIAETSSLEYLIPDGQAVELGGTQPAIAWLAATPMRETWRPCPLVPLATSPLIDVAALDAKPVSEERAVQFGDARPEIGWRTAAPMTETWRSCPPALLAPSLALDLAAFDAEWTPWADVAMPAPPTWNFIEGFEAGRVAMPVWQSAPVLAPARPMLTWTGEAAPEANGGAAEFSGTVAIPGLPGTMLAMGRMGPSFGWEHAAARLGAGPDACVTQDAVAGESAVQVEPIRARIKAVPSPTPAMLPESHQVLPGDSIGLPMEDGAVSPSAAAPKFHDFRARVRTGLPPGDRRGYEDWSQPRLDVSMIVTEPIAASRPALAEVHADMEQPYRFEGARFGVPNAAATPISARDSAGPQAIPMAAAASEIAVSGWPSIAGSLMATMPRTLVAVRGTADAGVFTESIQTAGPVRYSPVALVVVPPPQFAVLAGTPSAEERFAAQGPVDARSLPLVRGTGYRMMGPFPKLPPCMPESSFVALAPEFAAPVTDVPRRVLERSQDLTGLPQFPIAGKFHLHPADYWAWPAIKAPNTSRVAAEAAVVAPVSVSGPVRRFGPGRAGLQTNLKTADGQPRTRA